MDEHEKSSHHRLNNFALRTRCPKCNAQIDLKDDIDQWDQVMCPQCDVLLVLTAWRPLTLSVVEVDENELVYEDEDFGDVPWNDDMF
ncbi:MAG: hypothetical protein GYB65_04050 [Chloroflexi bacterium]|nr:hypothetical protein [Chloroflexota bacterium]